MTMEYAPTEAVRQVIKTAFPVRSTLPNPNVTGPCQVQASSFCEPSAGRQRLNPTDMLDRDTSFSSYTQICQPCYDHQSDLYVATVHGRTS